MDDPLERNRVRLNMRVRAWAVTPLALLIIFFAWPVSNLLLTGVSDDFLGSIESLRSGALWAAIWFTVWQALASTLLTLVVAAPLSAVMANVEFRGKNAVRALVTLPFVLPTVVVAGAFISLSERTGLEGGPFALRKSAFAIIAAHVFFNVAVVVRTVGGYWSQLSRDDEQAARTLGASPLHAFVTITLRRLRPAIGAALSIVFLFSFTSFGVVLILGGSRYRTLETEIYRFAINRTDFGTAAVLSIVQLLAVVGLVALSLRLRERLPRRNALTRDRARPPETALGRLMTWVVVFGTLCVLLLPVATMVEASLKTDASWTLSHFTSLTERPASMTVTPWRAIVNSVFFACCAAGIAIVIGGWASIVIAFGSRPLSRLTDLAYVLPLGTSAVTLGFGILITFDQWPVDLRQSWIIIPLAQALIAVPFVTRAVAPVLIAIDPHVREAAATLGAHPKRVRRDIDLPIARRALSIGAAFAFAISLGEFGATSFVGRRPDLMTLPLAIGRLLSRPGEVLQGQAMALGVLLMVITVLVLFFVDRSDGSSDII